jgi:hypothetical protein
MVERREAERRFLLLRAGNSDADVVEYIPNHGFLGFLASKTSSLTLCKAADVKSRDSIFFFLIF